MVKEKFITIKEIAEELGISRQTILRYERKGIFPKPSRNPLNRWRRYSMEDLKKLKNICGVHR